MRLPPPVSERFRALHAVGVAMLPLVLLSVFALTSSRPQSHEGPPAARKALRTGAADARTVVLIIDSLGRSQATDPTLMPEMIALAETSLVGPQRSCFGNFTLPCLLTTFEGRQSPFVAALNNFSADATGAPNWLDAARDLGLRVALISDHTLTKLYPSAWVTGHNYEDVEDVPVAERDAFAGRLTLGWLADREHDVVVTHIIGTDKSSHADLPGSEAYRKVFNRADAIVGDVARALDSSKDTLLVFGDHGHDQGGHHTRDSWFLLRGPHVRTGTLELDQTSLYFLLARPHAIPLPDGYEGALHWEAFTDDPREEAWREAQAIHWGLGADERRREDLDSAVAHREEQRAKRPRGDLLAFVPWLLHLLLIGGALAGHLSGLRHLPGGYLTYQAVWLSSAWLFADLIPPAWSASLALGPQLLWLSWPRRSGWSSPPTLLGWSVAALLSGLAIPWIVHTFHVRSGGSLRLVGWHAVVMGVPLALGALHRPSDGGSRWSFGALVAVAVCALLPTPGIYVYSSAQSFIHILLPATLLAILFDARPSRPRHWALLAAFAVGLPFVATRAGGWDWRFWPHMWAEDYLPVSAQLALAALATGLSALIWARRHPVLAWVAAALLIADGWLLIGLYEFETWRILGFAVLGLCMTGGLALLDEGRPADEAPSTRTAWQVTLIVGGAFLLAWSGSDGFFLKNLRLDFALRRLSHLYTEEADLAGAVAAFVVSRYALAFLPAVLFAGMTLGSQRLVALGPWLLLAGSFKLIAQSLQMLGVAFVEVEKSSDLLIQELIGMAFLLLLIGAALLVVALYRHALQWTLGRHRVE